MSTYGTSALFDTDIAALRGLGDNSPCGAVEDAAGRAACDSEWSRIQGAISPNTAGTNAQGVQIAALNQERARLSSAIAQLRQQRPDIWARVPASLSQLQPGEPGHNGTPATLASIRTITRRLRRLLAVMAGLAAGSSTGGGGGGGTPPTVTPGAEVAALNAARGQLMQIITAGFNASPELRATAPANLMREQPDELPRGTLPTLRATVARLQALVQWLSSQPASSGPGGYADIMPRPSRVVTAADFGAQWGSSEAAGGEDYRVAFFGGADDVQRYGAKPWATVESVGPQWGSSALPCGLGSWLSDAFRSVTGQRLSDTLPGIVSNIPVVGGIASNILRGVTSGGGQGAAAVAAASAAGGPCSAITDSARKAACQLAMAEAIDQIRQSWRGTSAAQPCVHLPAAQRIQCQGQLRAANDAIRAAYAQSTPGLNPTAALSFGPTTDADRAALAATSTAGSTAGKAIMPLALAAAAVLLLAKGRRS